MAKQPDTRVIRGYQGADITQDQQLDANGELQTALFVRINTLDVRKGKPPTKGATDWVLIDLEGLRQLAGQLTTVVATLDRIASGEDPGTIAPVEGVTMTKMPEGPLN